MRRLSEMTIVAMNLALFVGMAWGEPAPPVKPEEGTFTEQQLVQFIGASRDVVVTAGKVSREPIETTPAGFAALADLMDKNDALKKSLAPSGMSCEQWQAVGARAWTAWSVAQRNYNRETPLRTNARQLQEMREHVATAEAVIKSGVRILSKEERAKRVAAAHDAAVNATDRADQWAQKAAQLREQIAEAGQIEGANPGRPPADAVARNEALGNVRSARAAMVQELGVAERNERQAREDAVRFEESAQHPEQTTSAAEKADLIRAAQEELKKAKAEIEQLQEDAKLIQARVEEDRRAANARPRTAPPSDVELMAKHLVDFNDAWGMTVEGRGK